MKRRSLLINAVLAGLMGAAGALVGVPIVGFIVGPLVEPRKEKWRVVGAVDQFQVGKTVKVQFEDASPLSWGGVTARTAAWVRRDGIDRFTAFAANCTHLACPVRWVEGPELFMCPCHGGIYYKDGEVAAGPPPRRLFEYPVRIRGGHVEVRTSPIPFA